MNVVQKVEHWGDVHHAKWLDAIRVLLGLIIFSKGIVFISQTGAQQDWILQNSMFSSTALTSMAIIHTVAFVHIVGGLLITMGLLTRFAVVIQIPILLGAIFFVNIARGFTFLNSELWLSIVVLLMLVVFWVVGSGAFSVDHWINMNRPVPKPQPHE
ncbi:DoxX family protein [Mucilaginibacter terrae]|uniref:Oxidoreductase n=1 Tax=Mucilaginibacter terrae TaxID=1955052 RepID=A0ABU3GZJ3_9SPHI|nr:DoxX family protein [Mucilaginibacter terrae]MDT3405192.1 putative oxidoreductase [Mucilaginibacter terrae]